MESLHDALRAAEQGRISWAHAAAALDLARLWFQLRGEIRLECGGFSGCDCAGALPPP